MLFDHLIYMCKAVLETQYYACTEWPKSQLTFSKMYTKLC
jgi:hypothetical protein